VAPVRPLSLVTWCLGVTGDTLLSVQAWAVAPCGRVQLRDFTKTVGKTQEGNIKLGGEMCHEALKREGIFQVSQVENYENAKEKARQPRTMASSRHGVGDTEILTVWPRNAWIGFVSVWGALVIWHLAF
jgi:hypothetical protein